MLFSEAEIQALLAQKGIGATFVRRLAQMGLDTPAKLAAANPADILEQGAALTGNTCWKNSPQAKAAATAAVGLGQKRKARPNKQKPCRPHL